MTTKPRLRLALVEILEFAKSCRDLTVGKQDRRLWERVVGIAYDALDNPSIFDLDRIRREGGAP